MKPFMDEDFLLDTPAAVTLYHTYAEETPIFDFHSHLSAREIWEDRQFTDIAEAWLAHDHYKWRAMRANGIEERYITGDAPGREKFDRWAQTVPYLIGNPLYHWTHLELRRYFGITDILDADTAEAIYRACNEKLASREMSVRGLIRQSRVYALCTTDDPADDLAYHQRLREEGYEVKILPTFRPDPVLDIEKPGFVPYIRRLSETVGYPLSALSALERALLMRIRYFDDMGCRLSDHGLDEMLYADSTQEEAEAVYHKGLCGETLTRDELCRYKGYLLRALGGEYARRGWVMQLHIGALRDNASRLYRQSGSNIGCDSMGDGPIATGLSAFLDALDSAGELPKTVLYCINPRDNEMIATMAGNFQGPEIPGKIQFGSAWWFNDQTDGISRQLTALSQMGMVSRFIGMVTDSRSFLSLTRHEYFRRVLCSHFGHLIESGQYPARLEFVGRVIRGICFDNARRYILGETDEAQ